MQKLIIKGSVLEFERLEVFQIKRKITGKEAITKQANEN